MDELKVIYPTESQFVDSTEAARLNGYIGGFGTRGELELECYGLSDQAQALLLKRVSRR